MCVRSVIRNFLLPGIERLNQAFGEHMDAVKGMDVRTPPQMRPGQSQHFAHVNGLKEVR